MGTRPNQSHVVRIAIEGVRNVASLGENRARSVAGQTVASLSVGVVDPIRSWVLSQPACVYVHTEGPPRSAEET